MTFRASSEGTERIRCNCFITMGEPHCWVHICLINYTTSPRATLLFIKADVWHILPFSYLTLVKNSGGMRNDLRGIIRGQEAYLKQTDVAFKDRAEPQRCTTTDDCMGASFPETKAHLIVLPIRPCGGAFRGPSPRGSVAVGGRAVDKRRRGPSALGFPNYTQWGPSTLLLTYDLFPLPRLKAAALIVFVERRHSGRAKAC